MTADVTTGELTSEQWRSYEENGYLRLGKVLSDADLKALQSRIDAIMLGEADVDYSRMLMQLDSPDGIASHAGKQSPGFKGATLDYRKIQDLEFDPLFLEYLQRPLFREICRRVYGDIPIACFRAMFMNKPARRGTDLSWHQDRWTALDRDPQITVWTALDPATVANGCVQIVPGSHRHGILNPDDPSGFLTEQQAHTSCPLDEIEFLELGSGEAVLLHNWLLHASEVNATDTPRRAFSVCYMDARTVARNRTQPYPQVFGPDELRPETLASTDS